MKSQLDKIPEKVDNINKHIYQTSSLEPKLMNIVMMTEKEKEKEYKINDSFKGINNPEREINRE
jgi:hypothetical protein